MNILQLCPRIPYPLHDGGAIGMFNITKHLHLRNHQIHLVSLSKRNTVVPEELNQVCKVTTVTSSAGEGHSLFKYVQSRWKKMPYSVLKYQDETFYRTIEMIAAETKFDVVHVDHLAMAPYGVFLKNKFNLPIVLREHNLEAIFLERLSQNQKNPIIQWVTKSEYKKMRVFEPEICKKFDLCAMITENDELALREISSTINTIVIPAGVDIPEVSAVESPSDQEILFLASLDWKPNVDGFNWFYKNVLPQLVRRHPNLIVTIVGKGGKDIHRFHSHPNVHYIGFVNQVQQYLQRATMCIVPLFIGSGMRIKILEMMSYAKPIVSTSLGVEGIEAQNNREILIADSPDEFASSILFFLNNATKRNNIGINARNFVKEKHSWFSVAEQFEQAYLSLCQAK